MGRDFFANDTLEFGETLATDQRPFHVYRGAVGQRLFRGSLDHFIGPSGLRPKLRARQPDVSSAAGEQRQLRCVFTIGESLQERASVSEVTGAMPGRKGVQHFPTPDCLLWRVSANDKAISAHGNDGRLSTKLNEPMLTRFDLTNIFKDLHARQNLRRADMHPDALARAQRAGRVGQNLNPRIEYLRRT